MPASFTKDIQPSLLRVTPHVSDRSYGAVTLSRPPFQESSDRSATRLCVPIHHISCRIRFGLCRVHSRLLTTSQLRSLPAPTEMFQFRAFPLARCKCSGIPIRKSQVLRFHAAPLSVSPLGTSVIGSRAEPFTSQHSSQYAVGCVSHLRMQVLTSTDPDERVQWASGLHAYTRCHRDGRW